MIRKRRRTDPFDRRKQVLVTEPSPRGVESKVVVERSGNPAGLLLRRNMARSQDKGSLCFPVTSNVPQVVERTPSRNDSTPRPNRARLWDACT